MLLGIVRYVKPFLTVWYELRVASMYIELFSLPVCVLFELCMHADVSCSFCPSENNHCSRFVIIPENSCGQYGNLLAL